MKRLIFSYLLSGIFWIVSLTSGLANSTEPVNKVDNTNEAETSIDSLLADHIPSKNKISQIKVEPSSGSHLGACENDEYYVQISGARFGDGWDISSVTICGFEVCHILMQSSNVVIVYPNSGTPGTGDIVITSKSMGKTTIENAFTYKVPVPNEQSKNIQFSNLGDTTVDRLTR